VRSPRQLLGRIAAVMVLSAALAACAGYQARQKCAHGGCPDDARITAEVQALFGQHTELQAPNRVYVKTLDSVVYLSGKVATDLQRDTAVSLARGVAGVRAVNDNIQLSYRSGP
jgi:osmotically-inducible protein OsmY